MMEFLAMGGHGAYVWSAYGITLVVLGLNVWAAARRHRRALDAAARHIAPPEPARRPKVTKL
jgi:heme exporter protein D